VRKEAAEDLRRFNDAERDFLAKLSLLRPARNALAAFEKARSALKPLRADCEREKKIGQLPGRGNVGSDPTAVAAAASMGGSMTPASTFGAAGFYAGFDIGVQKVNLPSRSYFRIDAGGSFKSFPALRIDADPKADIFYQIELGYRILVPDLPANAMLAVALRSWYYNATGHGSSGSISPGPGESFGLFSPATAQFPFGGYNTTQTLSDISYRTNFETYGAELRLRYLQTLGMMVLEPWLGVAVGRTNVDDRLTLGIGLPAFTSFTQSTKIDSTFVGPTVGVTGTWRTDSGFYLQGTLRGGLQFHNADGRWRTNVPLVDSEPRTQNLSQNKTAYAVGTELGIGYRWGGLDVRLAFNIDHSNGSPLLKQATPQDTHSGTGGPTIGFGSQTVYGARAGATYRF
jgi:hypothetical protein